MSTEPTPVSTAPAAPAPAQTTATPTTTATPAAPATPSSGGSAAAASDVLAPVARLSSVSCRRTSSRTSRRCTVALRVRDADVSTGTQRVSGRATALCTSAQRKAKRCPASRGFTVKRASGSSTLWRGTRTLPRGRWRLRFVARDAAHAQPIPALRTVTVRR